jgi:hypothetical protein
MLTKRTILVFTVLFLAALACGPNTASNDNRDSLATSAALTVAAHNAQNQPPADPQAPPQAQPTNTSPQSQPPTAQPTNTTPPTATTKPTSQADCDKAGLVSETIPDGTTFLPDEPYTKKWVIKNEGSCTWNANYEWVFSSGDLMNGPATKPITNSTVAPGQTVEVSLDLAAPSNPGIYRGTYKIRNAGGQIFTANGFWVEIEVLTPNLGPPLPPPPQSDPVDIAATITLDKTWTFDLDTKTTGPAVGADFHYKIFSLEFIAPQNGAKFFPWGDFEPFFDDCGWGPLSTGEILIQDPNDVGTYFCFETDEGRLGYLKIDSFNPGSMTFSYIIWKNQ